MNQPFNEVVSMAVIATVEVRMSGRVMRQEHGAYLRWLQKIKMASLKNVQKCTKLASFNAETLSQFNLGQSKSFKKNDSSPLWVPNILKRMYSFFLIPILMNT